MPARIQPKFQIIQRLNFNFTEVMKKKVKKKTLMLIQFNLKQDKKKERAILVQKKDQLRNKNCKLTIKDRKEKLSIHYRLL